MGRFLCDKTNRAKDRLKQMEQMQKAVNKTDTLKLFKKFGLKPK
jgi:hypothetical protein